VAVSQAFRDHVADLLAPFGSVKIKLMFGGAGIYFKERMFGLIADERIYLKADDSTRPAFDAEGCKPFTFESKSGELMSMSYVEIPARLLDDADELAVWARRAYGVAVAAKGKKKSPPSAKTLPRDLPLVSPHGKPTASKAKRPRR
jgi:DNA transformation protein and related proteins